MIQALLSKYHSKGIIIDTNILLLYLVGTVNQERISRFKRTAQFTPKYYDLLIELTNNFVKVVATPNILTEVNSLANQLGEPERSKCLRTFAWLVSNIEEEYIKSSVITNHELFSRFGLADCGIMLLAKNKYLVLTDDLKLYLQMNSLGIDAINFNNLRDLSI